MVNADLGAHWHAVAYLLSMISIVKTTSECNPTFSSKFPNISNKPHQTYWAWSTQSRQWMSMTVPPHSKFPIYLTSLTKPTKYGLVEWAIALHDVRVPYFCNLIIIIISINMTWREYLYNGISLLVLVPCYQFDVKKKVYIIFVQQYLWMKKP